MNFYTLPGILPGGRKGTAMKKIIAIVIFLGAAALFSSDTKAQNGNCYSAYTENGIHLIISDNGTPGELDDDFICDWETNVPFSISLTEG